MGNDGGRIGKNSGISANQIEKYGSAAAAEQALAAEGRLGELHRHGARGSARRLGGQQFVGHGLDAGRRTGTATRNGTSRLGVMRAAKARELRALGTANAGRAGGVRGNNLRFATIGTGKGTSNPTLRNMTSNPYFRASASGNSRAAAIRNLNSGVKGMNRIGGKWAQPRATVTRNANGTWTASRTLQVSGSKSLNSKFTARTLGQTRQGRARFGTRRR